MHAGALQWRLLLRWLTGEGRARSSMMLNVYLPARCDDGQNDDDLRKEEKSVTNVPAPQDVFDLFMWACLAGEKLYRDKSNHNLFGENEGVNS